MQQKKKEEKVVIILRHLKIYLSFSRWKIKPNPEDEYGQEEGFMLDQGQGDVANDYPNIDTNRTTSESSAANGEESKFKYYLNFLRTLANTTYENLDKFKQYELDNTLNNLNVEDTILKVRHERSNIILYFSVGKA